MNDLNSTIFEGTVINGGAALNNGVASFCVRSVRWTKEGNGSVRHYTRMRCVVAERLKPLSAACYERCVDGRKVRIVGQLDNEENGTAYITAEHIEFRSMVEDNHE